MAVLLDRGCVVGGSVVTREFRSGELVGSWLAAVEEGAIKGRVVQGGAVGNSLSPRWWMAVYAEKRVAVTGSGRWRAAPVIA